MASGSWGTRVTNRGRLLTSSTLSFTGDYIYLVALGAWVFQVTDSTSWVAVSVLARMVPRVLLGAWGGSVADAFPLRRLLISLDLLRAAAISCAALVIWTSDLVPLVLVIVVIVSALSTPYGPAVVAALPTLVGDRSKSSLNAAYELTAKVSTFIGPALGAVLLATTSPEFALTVNGLTFVLSAIALAGWVDEPRRSDHPEPSSTKPSFRAGFDVLRSAPGMVVVATVTFASVLLFGVFQTVMPQLTEGVLDRPAADQGWLWTSTGLGGVVAGLVMVRASDRSDRWLGWSLCVSAIPLCAFAFSDSFVAAILLLFVSGVGSMLFEVFTLTVLQSRVRESLVGGAYGALATIAAAGALFGAAITPAFVSAIGLRAFLTGLGLVTTAIGVLAAVLLATPDSEIRHGSTGVNDVKKAEAA